MKRWMKLLTLPAPNRSCFGVQEIGRLCKEQPSLREKQRCCAKFLTFHNGECRAAKAPSYQALGPPYLPCGSVKFLSSVSVAFRARNYCSGVSSVCRGDCDGDVVPLRLEVTGDLKQYSLMALEAQGALFEYLHVSRGLDFGDAEHISKHSPLYVHKLLKKVENASDIRKELARIFRFHPINEFEPFFESIGLKPAELQSFCMADRLFLEHDQRLFDIYQTFYIYGIARGDIGKILRDAPEVLSWDAAALASKFQALEDLGLSRFTVSKLVTLGPNILIDGPSDGFLNVLTWFGDVGIQHDWIGAVLLEKISYKWPRLLELLHFLEMLGLSRPDIKKLIKCHPDFMSDGSGGMVFAIIAVLSKSGAVKRNLYDLFHSFPGLPIENFMKNLLRNIRVLVSLEMNPKDINKILIIHPDLLGSCRLMSGTSLQKYLNVGKRRLCKIIMNDPSEMLNFSMGKKLRPLPSLDPEGKSLKEKMKFLAQLGLSKDPEELKRALKVFRGKGDELQERYDFLVRSGFGKEDAANMIKSNPYVLNQKISILEAKMAFLVDQLNYPLTSLLSFPAYLAYSTERVKLRFLMYNWLKDRGRAAPKLALSSVLACSDSKFLKKFVEKHPEGLQIWESLKSDMVSG